MPNYLVVVEGGIRILDKFNCGNIDVGGDFGSE